jgi:hypothetical protein
MSTAIYMSILGNGKRETHLHWSAAIAAAPKLEAKP